MADVIQIRRDTAALWSATNPILASGEFGYESDTAKIKIGDGTTTWTSLGYYVIEGVTATAAELNLLDGVTATTAELNKLDGVTSTTAELNILDGVTATAAELNYVDGVTSNIQTQLNAAGSMNNVVEDTTPQLGGNLDVQSSEITTSTSNGNIKVTPNGSGVFEVKGAGGGDGTLQLNCSANSHGVKIKSPPHSAAASYTLTLPNNDGDADQVLQTNGSGVLTWASTPTLQATATGAITAGKPCKINSDGTVSQISATALTVPNHNYRVYESQHWDTKPFTSSSLATGASAFEFKGPGVCWDNHRNQFVVVGWDIYIKCYISVIGQIKNGTVLWGQVHKILESEYHDSSHASQNENGMAMWYDENFDRIVFIDEPYGRMAVGIPQEDGGYYWGHRAGTGSQQYAADQYFETEYFNGEAIILKRKSNDDLEIECATITQDYRYAATAGNAKRTIREKRCNTTDQEFTSTACATMALDRTNGEVCVAGTKGPTTQPWGVYLLKLDPAGDKSQNPSVLYDSGAGTSGDKDYLNVTYISPKKYLLTYQNSSGKAAAQVLTFSGSTPTYHTAVQLDTQDSKNTWVTVTKEQIFVRWYDHGASLTIDGSNDITVGTVEDYSGKLDYTILNSPGKQFAYSPVSDVGLLFMHDGAGETRGFSTSTFHPNTYIGIAQATVANAATATLDIAGGVNSQQSGLTIGKKYYVHYDGSIGTERSDVYAGMSTSATKLLVKG